MGTVIIIDNTQFLVQLTLLDRVELTENTTLPGIAGDWQ